MYLLRIKFGYDLWHTVTTWKSLKNTDAKRNKRDAICNSTLVIHRDENEGRALMNFHLGWGDTGEEKAATAPWMFSAPSAWVFTRLQWKMVVCIFATIKITNERTENPALMVTLCILWMWGIKSRWEIALECEISYPGWVGTRRLFSRAVRGENKQLVQRKEWSTAWPRFTVVREKDQWKTEQEKSQGEQSTSVGLLHTEDKGFRIKDQKIQCNKIEFSCLCPREASPASELEKGESLALRMLGREEGSGPTVCKKALDYFWLSGLKF